MFVFYNVLGKDNGAPLSTIDTAAGREGGAVAFATTQWTVVFAAQGASPEAERALERLCRVYWWPLFSFVKRHGYTPEEAQDLTQSFFAEVLEKRNLERVRQEKGRLRSYLLTSLKNFLRQVHRRDTRAKRGNGNPLVSLEELRVRESIGQAPANSFTPDRIYEHYWALALLEQVLGRLEQEYRVAGNATLFGYLKEMLADDPDRCSHADIAEKLAMTESAVKQAYYRLRQRYGFLLREEIAATVAEPGDVEDELRHFITVLQT